jgi:hypothetical protein
MDIPFKRLFFEQPYVKTKGESNMSIDTSLYLQLVGNTFRLIELIGESESRRKLSNNNPGSKMEDRSEMEEPESRFK